MITKTINSAATTNGQRVTLGGGAGSGGAAVRGADLYSAVCSNIGGAAAFVKLYNTPQSQNGPVVGTDIPILVIPVPAGGVVAVALNKGMRFANGVGLAITNLGADTDTTAVAAGQVKVALVLG